MVDETVKSLAAGIQTSVERLVQQFANAGIKKTENDSVTHNEKKTLLEYLNREDGTTNNHTGKLTLQRKTRSILNVLSTSGKSKSVNIEVRKKRTYIDYEILEKIKTEKQESQEKQERQDEKYKVVEKKHVKQRKINQKIIKSNRDLNAVTEKQRREAEVIDLKRKVEKETLHKFKIGAKRVADEVRHMAKENAKRWNINNHIDDNVDYHTTTYRHAREAEDENDEKEEGKRIKHRIIRSIRQKNNKNFEKFDREEERSVVRTNKIKSKQKKLSSLQQGFTKPISVINRDVVIGETISVSELANKMAIKSSQIIKTMMKMGAMVTINQILDQETAQLVAEEMGHKVILRRENELEKAILIDRDIGKSIIKPRSPVVTIMGHVDHGKTSLLDYIRSTKIASMEVGGITQHIGAYHVETDKGMITFLDTPGHAAFTSMRARGVKVTDIVVLVVAADDGVMPQTIEAIQHAKSADVPIVVAINKIDKTGSDPERVKNELLKYGIIAEDLGGENQFINVSAKTGLGIDELLQAILLEAEVLELKAIHTGMACGVVIESYLDKCRGVVATVLVQEGILNKGDIVLCGFEYGRIRAMRNELGKEIQSSGPSIPVEILGLSNIPSAGDEIMVVRNEKKAREVALYRQGKFREVKLANQHKLKLETMFSDMKSDKISELNIVLKTDVQGTCEAIAESLQKISTNKVKVKIIGLGVGGITETDATLASASNAIIIGFNVRADLSARKIIENENLDLRYYSVIYNLIDDIKQSMNGMLGFEYEQNIIGLAEVRNIFKSPQFSAIAGCMVIHGIIKRNNPIRILRDNIVIYEGELESLRRFKDDINEVCNGMECGIGVKDYNDIQVGDMIEVFEVIKIKRSIDA
ncbi:Translation initiation factor IF-2 [Candidatus Arsenophonus lipoptenae]|uniref:Translation initiation factor IF-2 n=1 Tax=Candidatus Arsenophonus lipoptenae TaxID=634113 RepID=A0A0X9VVZ9_9GAMM|nr:translation initiation factor IF-2 [Candidatus Arsenophonus lipoptenae]AMA65178.1 Translation initiation factor IF-2 [Candidatus Arsenophonus lipoptenae]